jgi:hypothetical protein
VISISDVAKNGLFYTCYQKNWKFLRCVIKTVEIKFYNLSDYRGRSAKFFFYRLKIAIVVSNPIRGISVCLRLCRAVQAEVDLPSVAFHQVSIHEIPKLWKSDTAGRTYRQWKLVSGKLLSSKASLSMILLTGSWRSIYSPMYAVSVCKRFLRTEGVHRLCHLRLHALTSTQNLYNF